MLVRVLDDTATSTCTSTISSRTTGTHSAQLQNARARDSYVEPPLDAPPPRWRVGLVIRAMYDALPWLPSVRGETTKRSTRSSLVLGNTRAATEANTKTPADERPLCFVPSRWTDRWNIIGRANQCSANCPLLTLESLPWKRNATTPPHYHLK